jgi:hypothetical protein
MEYHPISQRHCLDKGVKTCDKPPVVRAETGYFCAVGRAAVGAQLLSPPSVRIYIYIPIDCSVNYSRISLFTEA